MMTAVLFSSPVQRFVVDVQEKSSIDVAPGVDDDGIRSDSAWWASSPWKRSVADLDPQQSLAVLGEPGVGKSTTIAGLVGNGPSVNYVHLDEATDVRSG
jgi:ribosome biogenesis GTPase A